MTPFLPGLSWKDRAWLTVSVAVPTWVAAGRLPLYAPGGRDLAVVRTAGLGATGGFRALDAWVAAPFAWIPLGTRSLRAALPSVVLLAAVAALSFLLLHKLLRALAEGPSWHGVVATVATATATLSYPLQYEGANVGSGLLGAFLVLAALTAMLERVPSWPLAALLTTLGVSYDLGVGACVVAAVLAGGVWRASGPTESRAAAGRTRSFSRPVVVLAALLGFLPLILAVLGSHVTVISTGAKLLASPLGPARVGPSFDLHRLGELLRREVGEVVLVLAVLGLFWSLASKKGRPLAAPVAIVTLVAYTAALAGRSLEGEGWSADPLVAILGTVIFAGIAMHEAVLRVSRLRLPLASASAAMVVLLLTAFPAISLDEGLARLAKGQPSALGTWEDAAFTGFPSGTLVPVASPRLYARLLAAEASGNQPADVEVIPTFDSSNRAFRRALARDSRLVPLFRDLALTGVPEELSLSTLSSARPLGLATDPRWDRNLTRHLVPLGLLSIFEPEPRGGSDRKRALAASSPWRLRLARALGTPSDPVLADLSGALLFDRALAAAATGEREVALQSLRDAALFREHDDRIDKLTLRETTARGPVDGKDLARGGLSGDTP